MKHLSTIISKRSLTENTFVLRFERGGFHFNPGQYIVFHIIGVSQCREYSIYSSTDKPYLEILVKEIKTGIFTQLLKKLESGDKVAFEGPYGFFVLPENEVFANKYLFIATGTGISPFNSIINTYKLSNYKLLHGVRLLNESYDKENYNTENYILCSTAEVNGNFNGRVSSWLRCHDVDPSAIYYLCGNASMIDECSDILESYRVPPENIRSEVFF